MCSLFTTGSFIDTKETGRDFKNDKIIIFQFMCEGIHAFIWGNGTKNKKNERVLKYIKKKNRIRYNVLLDILVNFNVLGG